MTGPQTGADGPDSGLRELPLTIADGAGERRFGVYVHVPYCRVRCGYCDYNTYTSRELGGAGTDGLRDYPDHAVAEIKFAHKMMQAANIPPRPAATVFFGGGTPTLLGPDGMAKILGAIRDTWGLAADAEVTTETNPDSVSAADLVALAAAGFTRVSVGMQSGVEHVLATLERTHKPSNVPTVVAAARAAGLAASVDLIYGTPGETMADWCTSLETALALNLDHVSAYALSIEPGTRLARRVARGELPEVDDDDLAAKYERADEVLTSAGLNWYEISNWARPGHESRHNLGYWTGAYWWGIGPGAHSGFGSATPGGGIRFWNVKHPRKYAQRIQAGDSPTAEWEYPDQAAALLEQVMLGIRLPQGLDLAVLPERGRRGLAGLIADGLLDGRAALKGRAVLTLRGRLLADTVVHDLT